ncbi:hypothetical protein HF086_006796 [Spodoptera exigua]|uniref:Uncharacterized protein n=1 Tax=Spodoptera exigua TaxID=7107 RepID=A0A922M141_SPOEX|nr:hypothetical protein HF086_006796 [Spodoptera exigua]
MITDDLQSPFLQSSKQKRPVESSAGTSNPKSPETFSVFTDGSCGEPLEPQHLTIDFTPNEEMDTEFVQKKDRNIILETDSSSGSHKPGSKMDNSTDFIDHEFLDNNNDDDEKTAIAMLQFAEDKNLINRIFGAKMPSTQCSLGPREYVEDTKPTNPKKKEEKKKKKKKKGLGPSTSSPSVPCPQNASHVPNKKPSKANGSELSLLSRQLNDWDANHFK